MIEYATINISGSIVIYVKSKNVIVDCVREPDKKQHLSQHVVPYDKLYRATEKWQAISWHLTFFSVICIHTGKIDHYYSLYILKKLDIIHLATKMSTGRTRMIIDIQRFIMAYIFLYNQNHEHMWKEEIFSFTLI